jgi:hypothetical protein
MKKWIILLLLTIFLFGQTFAVTDYTPQQGDTTATMPQPTICTIDPSVLAKISVIQSQTGNAPTTEIIQGMFNQTLPLIGNALDEMEARILIIVIVANLCTAGIILAIIFYLKAQRRL